MEFLVRKAVPGDAERLIAHVHALAAEPDIDMPTGPGEFRATVEEERQILQSAAESDNSVFWVAEAGPDIIGVLDCKGGTRRALRHAAVLGVSVQREWRSRGVGTALMNRALEWARSTGVIKRIELVVYARNKRAIRLYEKLGFEVEGRRRNAVYQDGQYVDDLLMALLL